MMQLCTNVNEKEATVFAYEIKFTNAHKVLEKYLRKIYYPQMYPSIAENIQFHLCILFNLSLTEKHP